MRKWVIIGLTLFPLALGVVAGLRLSKESLAVVIGLIFGVGASLPLYILAFYLVRKERPQPPQPVQPNPPVIVVHPGGVNQLLPPLNPPQPWTEDKPRNFKIIGEEWED